MNTLSFESNVVKVELGFALVIGNPQTTLLQFGLNKVKTRTM